VHDGTLTLSDLDGLEKMHREATQRSSAKWIASYRNDGTGSVYSPSLGPCREIVPIAETMAEDAKCIADAHNSLPALLSLAREALEMRERVASEPHCPTCICGKRAPVQGDYGSGRATARRGPGSITWAEHLDAWSGYAAKYGHGQSAERLAERGGFSYGELIIFLGHEPKTWEPRRNDAGKAGGK
jgi:hypothetical protein